VREGMSFSDGVRSILRQDPDIVFIGEVRDSDTANMALRAAMTGHKVFTTLHTNDSLGAVSRLIDFGLSPGMLAGNIIAVLAQRLLRRLCPVCKTPYTASAEDCRILQVDPANPPTIYAAVGCAQCRHTGFSGRTAIAEVLPFNEALDEVIVQGGTRRQIRQVAAANGFTPLADSGAAKVLLGETSVAELIDTVNLVERL